LSRYPAWSSFVIGAAEIFAGAMLVLPRRRFLGAAVMLFILPGAIATHIINRDSLTDSIAAATILVSAIVALATWPSDWREPVAFRGQKSVRVPPQARKASVG
jgi:DoxX-like family